MTHSYYILAPACTAQSILKMSFTMSWDPSSAFRAAMEEQLARINKTIAAIDVNDADAEEMNRRLKTQRDDLESRLNGPGHSTTSVSTAGERKPEAVNSISPQSDGSGSPALMSKAAIRAEIGPELLKVAIPDSRFHCKAALHFISQR